MSLPKGRYHTQIARTQAEIARTFDLRGRCFGAAGAQRDQFDDICTHFMVIETANDRLVCSFRILPLQAHEISSSYSAQFYNLDALASFDGKIVEMGRFCVDPSCEDPDILRVAWAALTAYVDDNNVQFLFGCASFAGIKTDPYLDAFATLKARHLAPKHWLPQIIAPEVFRFAAKLRRKPDAKKAMQNMPPLLRTYLLMGGWVSDHAVIDRQMNTLHVFTGLEIGAIPPARKRLLRALVG